MFSFTTVGSNLRSFQSAPAFKKFSKVELLVSDDTTYVAGDDTGRLLSVQCPWGTQEMADYMLERLQSVQYQPYTASGVILDPAVELGDGISVNSNYGGLYSMKTKFGHTYVADVAAPAEEELDHEYPYVSPQERQVTRQYKQLKAELVVQTGVISAKVSNTGGDAKSFGWTLVEDSWSILSNSKTVLFVDKTGLTVEGKVTATSGTIGGCTIANGKLQVPAANIKGTLTAEQIDATSLKVDGANITGTLTAATISVDKLTAGSNDAEIAFNGLFTATNATIEGRITAKSGKIGSWNLGVNGLLENFYTGTALYTDPYYEDGVELVTSLTPEGLYVHYRSELEVAVYSVSWMDILRVVSNAA